MNRQRYISDLLRRRIFPYPGRVRNSFLFQDDDARFHCTRTVAASFQQNHVTRIDSPDVTLIWISSSWFGDNGPDPTINEPLTDTLL